MGNEESRPNETGNEEDRPKENGDGGDQNGVVPPADTVPSGSGRQLRPRKKRTASPTTGGSKGKAQKVKNTKKTKTKVKGNGTSAKGKKHIVQPPEKEATPQPPDLPLASSASQQEQEQQPPSESSESSRPLPPSHRPIQNTMTLGMPVSIPASQQDPTLLAELNAMPASFQWTGTSNVLRILLSGGDISYAQVWKGIWDGASHMKGVIDPYIAERLKVYNEKYPLQQPVQLSPQVQGQLSDAVSEMFAQTSSSATSELRSLPHFLTQAITNLGQSGVLSAEDLTTPFFSSAKPLDPSLPEVDMENLPGIASALESEALIRMIKSIYDPARHGRSLPTASTSAAHPLPPRDNDTLPSGILPRPNGKVRSPSQYPLFQHPTPPLQPPVVDITPPPPAEKLNPPRPAENLGPPPPAENVNLPPPAEDPISPPPAKDAPINPEWLFDDGDDVPFSLLTKIPQSFLRKPAQTDDEDANGDKDEKEVEEEKKSKKVRLTLKSLRIKFPANTTIRDGWTLILDTKDRADMVAAAYHTAREAVMYGMGVEAGEGPKTEQKSYKLAREIHADDQTQRDAVVKALEEVIEEIRLSKNLPNVVRTPFEVAIRRLVQEKKLTDAYTLDRMTTTVNQVYQPASGTENDVTQDMVVTTLCSIEVRTIAMASRMLYFMQEDTLEDKKMRRAILGAAETNEILDPDVLKNVPQHTVIKSASEVARSARKSRQKRYIGVIFDLDTSVPSQIETRTVDQYRTYRRRTVDLIGIDLRATQGLALLWGKTLQRDIDTEYLAEMFLRVRRAVFKHYYPKYDDFVLPKQLEDDIILSLSNLLEGFDTSTSMIPPFFEVLQKLMNDGDLPKNLLQYPFFTSVPLDPEVGVWLPMLRPSQIPDMLLFLEFETMAGLMRIVQDKLNPELQDIQDRDLAQELLDKISRPAQFEDEDGPDETPQDVVKRRLTLLSVYPRDGRKLHKRIGGWTSDIVYHTNVGYKPGRTTLDEIWLKIFSSTKIGKEIAARFYSCARFAVYKREYEETPETMDKWEKDRLMWAFMGELEDYNTDQDYFLPFEQVVYELENEKLEKGQERVLSERSRSSPAIKSVIEPISLPGVPPEKVLETTVQLEFEIMAITERLIVEWQKPESNENADKKQKRNKDMQRFLDKIADKETCKDRLRPWFIWDSRKGMTFYSHQEDELIARGRGDYSWGTNSAKLTTNEIWLTKRSHANQAFGAKAQTAKTPEYHSDEEIQDNKAPEGDEDFFWDESED
ncbi:uncharacterized protein I303_107547 [Kwoniella dejecticola CBS 10117]|uniref:Uncharacterized protein n=1 Tax=Kwoniella dejecticola CBS 10117 TaxID=1296121 RepID=A0A1A5ZV10_9TREE|nr:uncharacterized protein I303_07557 [Kwoniella dejecticola CBS 10117]OBR81647.1 hypothetical protein I303_07557 [Kwoniella dejecticola CBS 10117]